MTAETVESGRRLDMRVQVNRGMMGVVGAWKLSKERLGQRTLLDHLVGALQE